MPTTLRDEGRSTVVREGSRFVGYARPVSSVDDAEAAIDAVSRDHPDATHVIPAYRIRVDDGDGEGFIRAWASDRDEPSGSAGTPMQQVLERRGLEDVVVVVARYFGGTELGVGGLARAYASTTGRAIDDAGEIDRVPETRLALTVQYDDSGTVRGILESAGHPFEAAYTEVVEFEVRIPRAEADALRERLASATSGRVQIETVDG